MQFGWVGLDICYVRNINWSSPEVLQGAENVGPSSDVWSLAFVISEIMSGEVCEMFSSSFFFSLVTICLSTYVPWYGMECIQVPFDSDEFRKMEISEFQTRIRGGFRPNLPDFLQEYPWLIDLVSDEVS